VQARGGILPAGEDDERGAVEFGFCGGREHAENPFS
jgi:hypothetical protein